MPPSGVEADRCRRLSATIWSRSRQLQYTKCNQQEQTGPGDYVSSARAGEDSVTIRSRSRQMQVIKCHQQEQEKKVAGDLEPSEVADSCIRINAISSSRQLQKKK